MTYATSARLCLKIPLLSVLVFLFFVFFFGGGLFGATALYPWGTPSGAGGVVDSVLAASLRVAGLCYLEGSSPRSSLVPSRGSGSF